MKERFKKWNMKKRKFELVTEVDGKILKERAKLSNQKNKGSTLFLGITTKLKTDFS